MNSINMPRFTAEESLYKTSSHYRGSSSGGLTAGRGVQAALRISAQPGLAATCGRCICDPGQCCETSNRGKDCKCTTCGGSPTPLPPWKPIPLPGPIL